jgi:hypothetical protein
MAGEMTDISRWIADRIASYRDYCDHEWGDHDNQQQLVEWVIRCLANTECEGSLDVLAEINNNQFSPSARRNST